jgi:hypothetical protein
LATCSSQDNNTKIMVAVYSDLAVPSKIDEIRIDVKGPTAQPSLDFALATGKTKLPLLFTLVPPDNQNLQFTVTATAYLQSIPVVSQTARLAFAPGKSRILKLVLNGVCQGLTCPGMTCSGGTCQIIDVDVNSLTDYDPSAPLLPPDAGASPSFDGGAEAGLIDGGGVDAIGVDGGTDGQASQSTQSMIDGAESKTEDGPVSTGGTNGDSRGETNAGETNGAAGTGGIAASGGSGGGGTGGVGGGAAGAAGGSSTADAAPDAPAAGGATSTGGAGGGGSGGAVGTGGSASTGGISNGGAASGGGALSTGGSGTGGALATGGAATGGISTGGSATGGSATGGSSTGGTSTGGAMTGGVIATGGSSACVAPLAECDLNPATICETNTLTDATHCGGCPNRCTYPVCTAGVCPTPTVYGRNAVPADLTDPTIALNLGVNTLYGYRRAFSAASLVALGAVTSLSGIATARTFRVGLYTDNSGIPGALVATTDTLTAANGIVEGILSAPVPLSAGSYWIMVLVGNAGTVKFTKFVLPSPNTEVIKGAAGIADWPATATYVDVTPNNFVPNFYAKAVVAP